MPELGLPEQVVEGRETRVPLARDGHYWLRAEVNGHPGAVPGRHRRHDDRGFGGHGEAAGLSRARPAMPVRMQTANGTVAAQLTAIDDMRFGNVAAHGIDAIIAPGLGPTNVIGMNLLSRLVLVAGREQRLILVPHHPQPAAQAD